MHPLVCCKEHNAYRHEIYNLCDTNEIGEVRSSWRHPYLVEINQICQTALQHYCRLYKQEKVAQAHALLRKARRLDLILGVRSESAVMPITEDPADRRCHECQTQFAPAFYEISPPSTPFIPQGEATAWLCHRCHFATLQPPVVIKPIPIEPMAGILVA
jgi:hypothetical protein